LEKLQKREIEKPNPNISTPTISHSNWEVPLPNSEYIRPERLTKQVLVKKLQSRGIVLNGKENKDDDIKKVYPLKAGWALKENQKFGKKGAGKRMTNQVRTLLEGYFMAGNADKSNRYTAQDMQCELEKCAQEGEINKEDVPKVTTIQNWISKTTRELRLPAETKKEIPKAIKKAHNSFIPRICCRRKDKSLFYYYRKGNK
ncbi:hypothetical protein RhiirA1_512460, partial [Rhizophagus irregularis]